MLTGTTGENTDRDDDVLSFLEAAPRKQWKKTFFPPLAPLVSLEEFFSPIPIA